MRIKEIFSTKDLKTKMTPEQTAGYLQTLANKYGDFKVAVAYRDRETGEMRWTKHKTVMECWGTEKGLWFLTKVNNRQILPTEIILDLDENPTLEKLNIICDELEKDHWTYKAYFTGSRGYHIHISDPRLIKMNNRLKEQVRLDMIQEYGADSAKKTEVMIALENAPHWKTGKLKEMVREYPCQAI